MEWRQLIKHPNYEVSNKGDVRNIKRQSLFSKKPNVYGYNRIYLSKNGVKTSCMVHRLVAQVFIPNPNGYDQINHIDSNKLNNNVTNLEWCNSQMNQIHARDNGLRSKNTRLTKEQVIEIKQLLKQNKLSQVQIASMFNIHESHVSYIKTGKKWKGINI